MWNNDAKYQNTNEIHLHYDVNNRRMIILWFEYKISHFSAIAWSNNMLDTDCKRGSCSSIITNIHK